MQKHEPGSPTHQVPGCWVSLQLWKLDWFPCTGFTPFKAWLLTQTPSAQMKLHCWDYYYSNLEQLHFYGIHLLPCGQNLFPIYLQTPSVIYKPSQSHKTSVYTNHKGIFCYLAGASSEKSSPLPSEKPALPRNYSYCWSLGLQSGHRPG